MPLIEKYTFEKQTQKLTFSIRTDGIQYFRLEKVLNIHLSWHMHQKYSSDGSLSLAVTLIRPIQSVSLQHTKQVLLPIHQNSWFRNNVWPH